MEKNKKLLTDIAVVGIGEIFTKVIVFLLLPIYLAYLPPNEYGSFDYVISIQSLLLPCISLQLPSAMYRFIVESDFERRRKIITTGIFTLFISGALAFLIFLTATEIFNLHIALPGLIVFLFAASILDSALIDIIRAFDQLRFYAISRIGYTILNCSLCIIFVIFLKMGYVGLISAYAISAAAIALLIFIKGSIGKYISICCFDLNLLKKMLSYALPLLPNNLCWWIAGFSDRFIIRHFLGVYELGIYALAVKFSLVLTTVTGIFNTAWLTNAFIEYDSPNRDNFFSSVFNRYSKLLIYMSSGIVLLIQYVIGVINQDYQRAWQYGIILLCGALFSGFAHFYGMGYTCSKNTSGALFTTVYAALINIVVNLLMIRRFGLFAAAVSTLVSYLFLYIVRLYATKKYFKITVDRKTYATGMAILAVCYFLNYLEIGFWIHIIRIIMATVIILLNLDTAKYLFDTVNTRIRRDRS